MGDGQVCEGGRGTTELLCGSNPDVDGPVRAGDIGRDLALDHRPQHGRHIGNTEPVGRESIAVEVDLELGVAALGRGPDVGEAVNGAKSRDRLVAKPFQKLDVEAPDLDLDRGLEAEI